MGTTYQGLDEYALSYGNRITTTNDAYNVSDTDLKTDWVYTLTDDYYGPSKFLYEKLVPDGYHKAVYTTKGYAGFVGKNFQAFCIQVTRNDESSHWKNVSNLLLDTEGKLTEDISGSQATLLKRATKCCTKSGFNNTDTDSIAECGVLFGGNSPTSCGDPTLCKDIMRAYCKTTTRYDEACTELALWEGETDAVELLKDLCKNKTSRWWNICGCFYPAVQMTDTTTSTQVKTIQVTNTAGPPVFTGYSDYLNELSTSYEMPRADVIAIKDSPACFYSPCTESTSYKLATKTTCTQNTLTFVSCYANTRLSVGTMTQSNISVKTDCTVNVSGDGNTNRIFNKKTETPKTEKSEETDGPGSHSKPPPPLAKPKPMSKQTMLLIIISVVFVTVAGTGVGIYKYRTRNQNIKTIK